MAHREFRLPDIGEGTAEAELVAWHVQVGDEVEEDQLLCEVMTDKAAVEVTAPFAGRIEDRFGEPGQMLPVGSVVLIFATNAQIEAEEEARSPAAGVSRPPTPDLTAPRVIPVELKPIRTTPAVRKRAQALGVDLSKLEATGRDAHITHADLDSYLQRRQPPGATSAPLTSESKPAGPMSPVALEPLEGVEDVPVIGLRRRISERMQDTKRRIPHFSYIEEVDVTALEKLRGEMNDQRRELEPKLTILPFLIRAMTRVLPEFPQINALYDDVAGVVRRHSSIHAGIATQTPQGLVVTVLRDAGRKNLRNLASEIVSLSNLARAGRASKADLTGSTITITSLGVMGGVATTPVINSPEVAIVGVNKIADRAIVQEGQFRIAKIMNLSSSFDHRVVDGWDAAQFIQRVKAELENPMMMLL